MTSAHVISLIALFVALGGTGYAAVKLPKNSVGASQIKTGAVGSSEVKNGSLKKGDFKNTDLPAGPAGPQGTAGANGTNGAPGPAGSAKAFARIAADGTLQPDVTDFPSQVKGLTAANVAVGLGGAATGTRCFSLPFQPSSAMATLDNADTAAADRNLVVSVAINRGENLNDCPADHQAARVRIVDGNTEAATNARFFIWFEG